MRTRQPSPAGGVPARAPRRLAAVAGAVLLSACLVAGACAAENQAAQDRLQQYRQNLKREQQDLQAVQQRLRVHKRQVRQQKKRERSILRELQAADQRIAEAEERYGENERNLALVQNSLESLRAQIGQTEETLQALQASLAARLRLLYREGSRGFWRTLVQSRSLAEALARLKFFHILASQNAFWVERLRATRHELGQQRQLLVQREGQARRLKADSLRTLKRIQGQKKQRKRMLNKVRTERGEHERAVAELSAASRRLSSLVKQLEAKAAAMARARQGAAGVFAQGQKNLPWPTRGRITSYFGKVRHPRFNTYLYNKGIDIAGTIGQNVIAVAPGRVLFAEWFEGYGRMIILDHGHGFNTIYGYLAKILVSEGDTVAAEQVIGTLGDSGTWKGPALYFEIRQKGKALNPLAWLRR